MRSEVLLINISDSNYNYGTLLLKSRKVVTDDAEINDYVENYLTKEKCLVTNTSILLDCAFANYFIKELSLSAIYRRCFIKHWNLSSTNRITVILEPTNYDLIDYKWNERVYIMVRERCELDHALSWLSTLGGAFSALGDYFPNCAETAGKISFHQLKLALRLKDPSIAARCRLYMSLSLIQMKKFKQAKQIISYEYHTARNAVIVDHRLLNMCRGIWSKLQYEQNIHRRLFRSSLRQRMENIVIK